MEEVIFWGRDLNCGDNEIGNGFEPARCQMLGLYILCRHPLVGLPKMGAYGP